MRRLENYVRKYGPEVGPVLYHALQSQAGHASVSARLRRKLVEMREPRAVAQHPDRGPLPLFPGFDRDAAGPVTCADSA